jgi:hypothetical protein
MKKAVFAKAIIYLANERGNLAHAVAEAGDVTSSRQYS